LNLVDLVGDAETLTTITETVATGNKIAKYTDEAGEETLINETITSLNHVVTSETDDEGQQFDIHTLVYSDEAGGDNTIDLKMLIKGSETLTSLIYDAANHSLTYTDEKEERTSFNMVDLIGEVETLTTLELDVDDKKLNYTDENKVVHSLNLAPIIQEPWFGVTTNIGAISNNEDIYTNGWVGIGYTTPSDAPNEKLRVNGSITTVNSYYADYVFEDYFDGFSIIKDDYKFKKLEEVKDFIKENRHLPGITPIDKLEKTAEGYSFNVSELSIQLLEKTEELYLHMIEQENKIDILSSELEAIKKQNKLLVELLEQLKKNESLSNN